MHEYSFIRRVGAALALIALAMAARPSLFASGSVRFRQITVKDGLSKAEVTSILQDERGFMWFGTKGGLNRYDGHEIRIFKHSPKDADSLPGNYITSMAKDSEGFFWLGINGYGLCRFDPVNEIAVLFSHDKNDPTSIPSDNIGKVFVDRQDRVWVGTNRGLCLYDPREGDFKEFKDTFEPQDGESTEVTAICQDEYGAIWAGSDKNGLFQYDPETNMWRNFEHDANQPSSLSSDEVRDLLVDHSGKIWVATLDGLNRHTPGEPGFERFFHKPGDSKTISSNALRALHYDGEGRLWVGAVSDGLNLMDPETGEVERFLEDSFDSVSFKGRGVVVIFQDRWGDLWIGSDNGGVNTTNRVKAVFKNYKSNPREPGKGLSEDSVLSVAEDRKKIIWIGTFGDGLNRFDPASETFRHFKHREDDDASLSDDYVWSICEDRQDRLWVGTSKGLDLLDRRSGRFKRYRANPGELGLEGRRVRVIYEDSAGKLWIGLRDGGLNQFDPDREEFEAYVHDADIPTSLSNNRVLALLEDRQGRFWVGASGGGLNLFDRDAKSFQHFRENSADSRSLSDDRVLCLYEDSEGRLWVGANLGLNRMEPDGSFTVYLTQDGLPDDTIYALQGDDMGAMWLSTNKGVARFDPQEETFQTFDFSDGLQGDEFNVNAAARTASGRLYFGGNEGLSSFEPRDFVTRPDAPLPKATVIDFLLFNQSVKWRAPKKGEAKPILTRPIGQTREIELGYENYLFSLKFTSLPFADSKRIQYAYMLENFDEDWIFASPDDRVATYNNPGPGDYLFRVKVVDPAGEENEAAPIRVRVLPPPWRTWWAYLLYILALAALVFGLAYVQTQGRKLAYERSMVGRLRQLDRLKDDFLANTSHEVRTPLNGIIGIVESLMDGVGGILPDKAKANLSLVLSSGKRLSHLVNDLIDFSKLKNQSLSLYTRPVDLRALADVVLGLSSPLVTAKNLALKNEIAADIPMVMADENRLQQILFNLVGNAVKFTQAGWVKVSAQLKNGRVVVSVADTGIGIPADKFERIFESFEQADGSIERSFGGAGLGLAVTKQLVELHGGEIWVDSTLGEGTVMSFSLPAADKSLTAIRDAPQSAQDSWRRQPDEDVSAHIEPAEVLADKDAFHIMIVDDEPINRQVLVNHLALSKYRLCQASSGYEALRLLEEQGPFDLVLLDIMMPRMSGYEACRQIRKQFTVHELPIIFLTALTQESDLASAFEAGANDFLTKPVSRGELLARVKTHLQLLDTNRNLEQKVIERTEKLNARKQELETLDDIVKTVNQEIQLKDVLDTLLVQGRFLFPQADKGTFLMREVDSDRFQFAAALGYDMAKLSRVSFSVDELHRRYGRAEHEIEEGVYLVREAEDGSEPSRALKKISNPKCMLSMAITVKDRLEGVLVWDNLSDSGAFDQTDVRKLARYRRHAQSAVAKAMVLQELWDKHNEVLRTQKQLVMQEKMASMGILTAGIAHEIKNPLNFVNNFSGLSLELFRELGQELGKRRGDLSDEAFSYVQELLGDLEENAALIHQHGQRANRIVESMMNFARGEVDEWKETDINVLVDEFTNIASHGGQPKDRGQRVAVERSFDPSVGVMQVESQGLSRVIINLVNNALDAVLVKRNKTEDDRYEPRVWVRTVDMGDRVQIRVEDNGIGVKPENVEKIFDPFYTTKPSSAGNIGLGLAISYDIVVQEHDGDLRVESGRDRTAFVIELPKQVKKRPRRKTALIQ